MLVAAIVEVVTSEMEDPAAVLVALVVAAEAAVVINATLVHRVSSCR